MILNKDAVRSPYDIRDYTIAADKTFPEEFSLGLVPVKNQGMKPTCVAHAFSSVVEYHHLRQHGSYEKFSTEFIYGLREDGYYIGDGMCMRDALKTLQKYGNVPISYLRGNNDYEKAMENVRANFDELTAAAYPHRISSYFKINNAEELKTALMKYGVVGVSMNTYRDAKLVDDVYTYDPTKGSGRHCVFIYGWNKKGWLVQNSWGVWYGGDGRFILPFDFKLNESWGIVDNITEGGLVKPKRNKWLDILYRVFNVLVNVIFKLAIKQ